VKKVGIILTAALLLASCGWSGYNLDPSFLRYPFEKIFDYELQTTESSNEVMFVPESTLEEGVLVYEYYNEGSELISSYSLTVWDGSETSSLTTSFGSMYPYAFPLTDANTFVQVFESTTVDYTLAVFQADTGSASQTGLFTPYEVSISGDFGVGNYGFGYPCFESGRLYFITHTETEIAELSYSVTAAAIGDPQATWATAISMSSLYEQFFKDVQEGDTFWQAPDVEIDGYRHYPSLNGGTSVLVASMDIEFQESGDIRFIITYDGAEYAGLQISGDVYNVQFLSGGYVVTEELDPDIQTDIVTLYDCTGTAPVEVDSLTFQQDELAVVGESVYNDEAVILWTPEFDDLYDRTKAALYALPLSYLLEEAE